MLTGESIWVRVFGAQVVREVKVKPPQKLRLASLPVIHSLGQLEVGEVIVICEDQEQHFQTPPANPLHYSTTPSTRMNLKA